MCLPQCYYVRFSLRYNSAAHLSIFCCYHPVSWLQVEVSFNYMRYRIIWRLFTFRSNDLNINNLIEGIGSKSNFSKNVTTSYTIPTVSGNFQFTAFYSSLLQIKRQDTRHLPSQIVDVEGEDIQLPMPTNVRPRSGSMRSSTKRARASRVVNVDWSTASLSRV